MSWLSRLFRPAASAPRETVETRLAVARAAAESGDYQTALGLWRELAPNAPRAASNIGACFAEGLGVERAPDLAFRWLSIGAEAGDPVGQRNLATLYFRGEGIAQSDEKAQELYRRAAELGDADGQAMLGAALLMGAGVARDDKAARVWLLRAREGGSPLAARYLTAATPGAAP